MNILHRRMVSACMQHF